MNLKKTPFRPPLFSKLFCTYAGNFNKLSPFYETDPFNIQAIKKRADTYEFKGDRQKMVKLLLKFNEQFAVDDQAIANIKKLHSNKALALVTGQQLGIFGGPIYTFFKIITVIHLARQLENELKRPVVPVFWLADEDHDFEEVRSVNVLNKKGIKAFSLTNDQSDQPVSDIHFSEQLETLKKELREYLIDTDFSDHLWELVDSCFSSDRAFLNGFGAFISSLFSKHGLVLAGSHNTPVKEFTKDVLVQSVKEADGVDEALIEVTEKLEEHFHQQVTLNNSHLFYLSKESGRIKINRNEEGWRTGNGNYWSKTELIESIKKEPEKFSPDVFLRPLIQDKLLPTIGYIGGPGEVAYYGQMRTFYQLFGMKMPVVFPRLSATFIEPAIDRIFQELPFEFSDYRQRIEDLETKYAKQSEDIDIETTFKKWKEGIQDLEAYHSKVICQIDETLEGTSKKAKAHYFNELNKLKGKTYRAVKKNETIQMKRIHRTQNNLFPYRSLQERTLSGVYYMNKFGVDIWDRLLKQMENEDAFNQHTLIYL